MRYFLLIASLFVVGSVSAQGFPEPDQTPEYVETFTVEFGSFYTYSHLFGTVIFELRNEQGALVDRRRYSLLQLAADGVIDADVAAALVDAKEWFAWKIRDAMDVK